MTQLIWIKLYAVAQCTLGDVGKNVYSRNYVTVSFARIV